MAPCGRLWQPVAAVWTPLYIDFSDFGGILTCWIMIARLMEAEQGLGGCWMMNGRQIGRSSHTLELEELGGLLLIDLIIVNYCYLRIDRHKSLP